MIPQNQIDFLINRIVDQMTACYIQDNDVDLPTALKMVYGSKLYERLLDTEGGLYAQSPWYVYELLKEELASPETTRRTHL